MNRRLSVLLCTVLSLAALVSCSYDSGGTHGSLSIQGNKVRISVDGEPPASIANDGTLLIGGQVVALSTTERTLAQHYYQDVLGVTAAGKATGKAGAALGGSILGSLFSALWHDDSSIIKHTADAGTAAVKAQAEALCAQLRALHSAQNALAAAQPAFMPYRVIHDRDVTRCLKGVAHHVVVTYAH